MFVEQFTKEVYAKRREDAAECSRRYEIKRARRQIVAPAWVVDLLLAVAEEHKISPADIISRGRGRAVVAARNEAIYRAKMARPMASLPRLGLWFHRDHTTIGHSLARYQRSHPDAMVFTRFSIEKRHASTANFQARRALRLSPQAAGD